jgi:hypothetical protein
VQRAPGFPCALFFSRDENSCTTRAHHAAGSWSYVRGVIVACLCAILRDAACRPLLGMWSGDAAQSQTLMVRRRVAPSECRACLPRAACGKRPKTARSGGFGEGTLRDSECVESSPHPDPLRARFARLDPAKRARRNATSLRSNHSLCCRAMDCFAGARNDRFASTSSKGANLGAQIRSARLTIFGIAAVGLSRLESLRKSAVSATNRQWFWPRIASKGSGNADSQRFVRSSREGGHCR